MLNLIWEHPPNPNCAVLHTNVIITNKGLHILDESYAYEAPKFIQEIYEIEGITESVFCHKYYLQLTKGICFDWETIKPMVEQIIRKHFENIAKANDIIKTEE